jgi:hypothetical protein
MEGRDDEEMKSLSVRINPKYLRIHADRMHKDQPFFALLVQRRRCIVEDKHLSYKIECIRFSKITAIFTAIK